MRVIEIMQSNISKSNQMNRWQALLDAAGECICGLDLEGRCTFVNRKAAKTFGFSADEMVGEDMHALIHHHYPDGSSFPAEECPIHRALKTNKAVHQASDTMFRKDGSPFVVDMSAQPLSMKGKALGIVVTFHDVTELHRKEEEALIAYELAEQRTAELDAVIESMPHGVYVATKDRKLRSNKLARMMSGESFPRELTTLTRALKGESSTQTAKTGERWIHSTAAPIFLNGKILGGVAVNTDVTQLRLQDEALRRSERLAAVGQLASSIAHEINNPLESITNLLYLIRESDSMVDVQEYAKLAQEELARVTQITLQTLRFNRQQSKPVEVDMALLLRTVMQLYTGRLLVRDIAIELDVDDAAPKVMCLEGEIRQVVNNLVRNALDAMATGGRLLVRLHPQHDWQTDRMGVRVTVADTGEGIRAEMLPRLFEPFQTTKELTGTGLGLWVSKGIVEKHDGRILVQTRREGDCHGTVFAVWLPVKGAANLAAQAS